MQELVWGPSTGFTIKGADGVGGKMEMFYIPPTRTKAWEDSFYSSVGYAGSAGAAPHVFNDGGSSTIANVDCKAVRGQNLPSYWNAEVSAGVAGGRGGYDVGSA